MLCTVDNVKSYIGINTIDSTEDALIETLIDAVSTMFVSYCGRGFESATYTEYYSGNDYPNTVYTNNFPIITVSGIYDDTSWTFGSDTLISGSNYMVDDISITLLPGYVFSAGKKNIKVIYTAGYSTIPSDIKQACIEEAARKYKRKDRIDISAISLSNESISMFSDEFLPATKIVLNRYKRYGVC
jgi:hypothetical protein